MYLHVFPHREYPPISDFSVNVIRPETIANDNDDDDDENDDNKNGNEENNNNIADNNNAVDRRWRGIDTGNTFESFELYDIVMAWYDDAFYIATIMEIEKTNKLFTILFTDDNLEVNSYKACWLKHLD
jgi:hypothetical protein